MRHGPIVLVVVSALASCSLVTSWDDLGPPAAPEPSTVSDAGDASADVALLPDVAAPVDAAMKCPAPGYYCGDAVGADPGLLYRCNEDGSTELALRCSRGCLHRAPGRDMCECTVDGDYCGNDQVLGDPKVLYQCNSPEDASVIETCGNTCVVRSGANDFCDP